MDELGDVRRVVLGESPPSSCCCAEGGAVRGVGAAVSVQGLPAPWGWDSRLALRDQDPVLWWCGFGWGSVNRSGPEVSASLAS
ncbi:MAG: hypothetical protein ABS53_05755 [Hydrogenophaga sp. SCN 70-13]|nr:MAG: hypothetical protein ABS53_05755 [Hydrogenophaga sp. SCN 70-13]